MEAVIAEVYENRILQCLLAGLALLTLGSLLRCVTLGGQTMEKRRARLGSLATWWVLFGLLSAAVLCGRAGGVLLFALASTLGTREFLRLIRTAEGDSDTTRIRLGSWIAYGVIPAAYGAIYYDQPFLFLGLIPVVIGLGIPARMVAAGRTKGFMTIAGRLEIGIFLLVFCLAHAALLMTLPESSNPVAGGGGWLLYLVLLTECNDIAQALWGRRFGRRKITPRISPNKTIEGFVLGLATTILLAVLLAPCLTPMMLKSPIGFAEPIPKAVWAVLAGLLIGVGGLFGDLTMSAIKRDVGVKDTGAMLPGQGGVLDRVDSLTFTSPLFYYFVYLLYA